MLKKIILNSLMIVLSGLFGQQELYAMQPKESHKDYASNAEYNQHSRYPSVRVIAIAATLVVITTTAAVFGECNKIVQNDGGSHELAHALNQSRSCCVNNRFTQTIYNFVSGIFGKKENSKKLEKITVDAQGTEAVIKQITKNLQHNNELAHVSVEARNDILEDHIQAFFAEKEIVDANGSLKRTLTIHIKKALPKLFPQTNIHDEF